MCRKIPDYRAILDKFQNNYIDVNETFKIAREIKDDVVYLRAHYLRNKRAPPNYSMCITPFSESMFSKNLGECYFFLCGEGTDADYFDFVSIIEITKRIMPSNDFNAEKYDWAEFEEWREIVKGYGELDISDYFGDFCHSSYTIEIIKKSYEEFL